MVHIEMQAIIPLAVFGTCVPAVPAEDDDVAHVQVDRINSLPILPVIDEELAALLDSQNATTFWDPSQAGPSQDLFLARIIPENQGVNHTPLRTRSRAHGALRANFQPPGCCGQCSSGQLRAAQGSSGQLS